MGAFASMFSHTFDPTADMPDLHGKVAIVTGGNAGIGYSTIKFLALAGAKVYMASRSEAKARQAIEDLYSQNPELKNSDAVQFLQLDLASIQSVVNAADEFKRKETRLDILINNGASAPENLELSVDGFEMTMAACHIGHFVLVDRLFSILKLTSAQPGSDVRVITVSSNAHHMMIPADYDFNFASPTSLIAPGIPHPKRWPLSPFLVRYAIAKTANTIFAAELQRRCDADPKAAGILSMSVHPGGVNTKGASTVFFEFIWPLLRTLFFISPDKGAVTSLFAATTTEVREHAAAWKGQYLVPYGKVGTPHQAVRDEKVVKDLWETTRMEVDKCLAAHGLEPLSL